MSNVLLADIFHEEVNGRILLRAMPLMLGVLGIFAIAYRYYSAFLAAKVLAFDDTRVTPAYRLEDGQNYHPTNRWVLFGHHFAAISGAGPLIGPVLAIQYGYAPGLIWLIAGVCLAGAVQDMLVMAVSARRDGKSLAEIARRELGPKAAVVASIGILFIVVIALAGLGFVIVKALGGEDAKLPVGMKIVLPADARHTQAVDPKSAKHDLITFPGKCDLSYPQTPRIVNRPEAFVVRVPNAKPLPIDADGRTITLPAGCTQVIKGSSWGAFTITCTIPIALIVGFWMYRLRKGRIVEASIFGAAAVIAATIAGSSIPGSALEEWFSWDRETTILLLCGYGFVASVLPVWLLLGPRDYLSSFLKIGTVVLMIVGVIIANPVLHAPPINETMRDGGPTFEGGLFPFVFICVMCGAISGFHALVSSGTTPKMLEKESHVRMIGYGAMLTESLVGVIALIAAAAMPVHLYYDMNTDLEKAENPVLQKKFAAMYERLGVDPNNPGRMQQVSESGDSLHHANIRDPHQLRHADLSQVEEMVGGESLRGRTGGAVTLAVSMAMILTDAFAWADANLYDLMKYWYHFAIMFEALFILTTIDAGTRIARFLLQETLAKVHPKFERPDWVPGALLATAIITLGYGLLIHTGSIGTIWPMFGIANQLLAVLALALVTTYLVNHGRAKYAWVTLAPMGWVCTTTLTAGTQMLFVQFPNRISEGKVLLGWLNICLTLFVIASVLTLLGMALARWLVVLRIGSPSQAEATA